MWLSTTVRYGARAMAQVASAYPDRPVSIREIAEQQRIAPKYLEHIFRPLRTAGLVRATRGKQGGFMLTRPPQTITLKDLFEVLDGAVSLVDCLDHPDCCAMHEVCPTRDTWIEIKQSIEKVLQGTTIQDLVERKKRKTIAAGSVHRI